MSRSQRLWAVTATLVFASLVRAAEPEAPAQEPSADELAKQLSNPIANLSPPPRTFPSLMSLAVINDRACL